MTDKSVKNEEVVDKMDKLENVLKMMDRVNEGFSYEVWIPSLKRNVMFREINTSQQKRLIKSIIDSPVFNTEFIFTLKTIIEENCTEKGLDVNSLTIIDKFFIALKMRLVSMGDTVEMEFPGEGDLKLKRGISIEKIINDAKESVVIPEPASVVYEQQTNDGMIGYKIDCSIPTIYTEYKLENDLRRNIDESNEKEKKDMNDVRKLIGDVFISEIVKFVNSISIKMNEKISKISVENLSFRDRILLLEKFPAPLLKMVINYINTVKKEVDKITVIKVNIDGKEVTQNLKIEGSFFISSSN